VKLTGLPSRSRTLSAAATLRILGVKNTEQFFLLLHPLCRGLPAYTLFAFALLLSCIVERISATPVESCTMDTTH
jgi:hypothetical protein